MAEHPDLIITIDDIKKAGLCAGFPIRRWFVDQGFDYQRFLREGAPASDLLATGDGHALMVVERALARRG